MLLYRVYSSTRDVGMPARETGRYVGRYSPTAVDVEEG